ncbi:hypothetical protein LJC34_03365 [Oscillospiraceae bacterium OttesenSCG-928-G22]|nr:hypothetical protein [Oscillospiraceae bacterium OttesenSCG-928-G22]
MPSPYKDDKVLFCCAENFCLSAYELTNRQSDDIPVYSSFANADIIRGQNTGDTFPLKSFRSPPIALTIDGDLKKSIFGNFPFPYTTQSVIIKTLLYESKARSKIYSGGKHEKDKKTHSSHSDGTPYGRFAAADAGIRGKRRQHH